MLQDFGLGFETAILARYGLRVPAPPTSNDPRSNPIKSWWKSQSQEKKEILEEGGCAVLNVRAGRSMDSLVRCAPDYRI